jgi:hypothetical protein
MEGRLESEQKLQRLSWWWVLLLAEQAWSPVFGPSTRYGKTRAIEDVHRQFGSCARGKKHHGLRFRDPVVGHPQHHEKELARKGDKGIGTTSKEPWKKTRVLL